MDSNVTIDYETLVADYMHGLTSVLRGFASGGGHEFLATWVRDEDDAQSVLGIVEAARDAGLASISICLGPGTLAKVDLAKLRELLSRQGRVSTEPQGAGLLLTVSLAGVTERTAGPLPRRRAQSAARETPSTAAPAPAQATPAPVRMHSTDGALNSIYAERLSQAAQSRAHDGALDEEQGCVLAQGAHDGVKLMAVVERSRHIVKRAAYQGGVSQVQRGLLEGLCPLLVGKPILECSDHAVIFLEFELRDHSQPRPVSGILTPENADAMFALPTALARGLLADYRRKTGFESTENHYDPPISARWRALAPEERMNRIRGAVALHPAGCGAELIGLETPRRAVVRFTGATTTDSATEQSRLMELEGHLKSTVERTLQLYAEAKDDQSKLRRLKGVNTS